MLRFAFIMAFIISAASAALGLLLANKLRRKNSQHPIFTTLLYQQIFIFIFALYSIWGFILFKLIFSTELLSRAIVEKISAAQIVIAIPFQLFSWWFLLQLIFQLVHIKNIRWAATLSLAGIIVMVFPVYWLFFENTGSFHHMLSPLFCIENSLVYLLLFVVLFALKSNYLNVKNKLLATFLTLGSGLLISASTLFYANHVLLTIAFIVLFFLTNLWPVVLFSKWVKVPQEVAGNLNELGFEALCNRYEISKREAEIVACICQGLTNQQIADKLFITLQTVKDHTSRIYLKTEVKNRTQLANLFR